MPRRAMRLAGWTAVELVRMRTVWLLPNSACWVVGAALMLVRMRTRSAVWSAMSSRTRLLLWSGGGSLSGAATCDRVGAEAAWWVG